MQPRTLASVLAVSLFLSLSSWWFLLRKTSLPEELVGTPPDESWIEYSYFIRPSAGPPGLPPEMRPEPEDPQRYDAILHQRGETVTGILLHYQPVNPSTLAGISLLEIDDFGELWSSFRRMGLFDEGRTSPMGGAIFAFRCTWDGKEYGPHQTVLPVTGAETAEILMALLGNTSVPEMGGIFSDPVYEADDLDRLEDPELEAKLADRVRAAEKVATDLEPAVTGLRN